MHEPADAPDPGAQTSWHVRHAIDGAADSVAWLIRRLSPLLIAQAEYRIGNALRSQCDPEDLVHDAWLAALPRLGALRARNGRYTPVLLRFLGTAVLNRVHNLLKRQRHRSALQIDATAASQDGAALDPASQHSEAVTRAIRNETRAHVRELLDGLGEPDREIVLLRGIEQQPMAAVAAIVGLHRDATAKRYQRALARLRDAMPGSVFDEFVDE